MVVMIVVGFSTLDFPTADSKAIGTKNKTRRVTQTGTWICILNDVFTRLFSLTPNLSSSPSFPFP